MSDDCTWTLARIDDHVDGDLELSEAERLVAHLAICADCAAVEAETRSLLAMASSLAADVPPSAELWSGIEEAIRPARRAWAWTPARLAAAALVLVALSSGLTALWLSPGSAPAPTVASAPEVFAPIEPSADTPEWRTEMDVAMTELTDSLDARRSELDPEALRVIDENIAIIDTAIAEIDQALAQRPDDRHLRDALLAVHRQKVQLLVGATHLPG